MSWVSGNYSEINITRADARGMSHSGDCEADVRYYMELPKYRRQLDKIGHDTMVKELRQYGAWDAEELADQDMTRVRYLWCMAGNLCDELAMAGAR